MQQKWGQIQERKTPGKDMKKAPLSVSAKISKETSTNIYYQKKKKNRRWSTNYHFLEVNYQPVGKRTDKCNLKKIN